MHNKQEKRTYHQTFFSQKSASLASGMLSAAKERPENVNRESVIDSYSMTTAEFDQLIQRTANYLGNKEGTDLVGTKFEGFMLYLDPETEAYLESEAESPQAEAYLNRNNMGM